MSIAPVGGASLPSALTHVSTPRASERDVAGVQDNDGDNDGGHAPVRAGAGSVDVRA